jgi:hypothetical protein
MEIVTAYVESFPISWLSDSNWPNWGTIGGSLTIAGAIVPDILQTSSLMKIPWAVELLNVE